MSYKVQCSPDTIDTLSVGRVLANRINDVIAKPSSKRHQSYLNLMNRQIRGFDDRDPNDMYRERPLVASAIAAYNHRHGVNLSTGWFYSHYEYKMLACAPDAVESDSIGITVHIRQTEERYEEAVERSNSPERMRAVQAAMAITGFPYWIELNYWEDRPTRKRRLQESLFAVDEQSNDLLYKMTMFYCKATRHHLTVT